VIWNERAKPRALRGQRDIVRGREIRQQRRDLERARQAKGAAPPCRQAGDVPAGEANGAGIRQHLPGELADQRGLAGAVRPDDRMQFARCDIQRQVVGGDNAAEPPHQIFDAEQGVSHGLASRAGP
jgi:hypothetical protein